MRVLESVWECIKVCENESVWECKKVCESIWECMTVCVWELFKFMKVHKSVWKSMKVIENVWVNGTQTGSEIMYTRYHCQRHSYIYNKDVGLCNSTAITEVL